MAAMTRRALEEEFDAVGEEGHACEAEMEECIGGVYGPDDDADAHEGSSDSDSDTEPPNVMDARAASLGPTAARRKPASGIDSATPRGRVAAKFA